MLYRRRRVAVVVFLLLWAVGGYVYEYYLQRNLGTSNDGSPSTVIKQTEESIKDIKTEKASDALGELAVKGRSSKTDYKRSQFGDSWEKLAGCDTRNYVLKRDMTNVVTRSEKDCTVLSGVLNDPYTAKQLQFMRGPETSDDVQIDHVVALSDAWQKGAQSLSFERRVQFANDMLNLLAVDGQANQGKSSSDAASWLPPNKSYRCMYVARQVAVKKKYELWVTDAEKAAIKRVLNDCPDQQLPLVIEVKNVQEATTQSQN